MTGGADRLVAAPIVVLEDDPTTLALIRQVLLATNLVNPLEFFGNGTEAIAYIERRAPDGTVPVMVILDLAVPGLSGLEVLRRLRARPSLTRVSVVVLSVSERDEDIERCYELGIDAYLVKPAGVHGLPDVIAGLGLPYALLARPA